MYSTRKESRRRSETKQVTGATKVYKTFASWHNLWPIDNEHSAPTYNCLLWLTIISEIIMTVLLCTLKFSTLRIELINSSIALTIIGSKMSNQRWRSAYFSRAINVVRVESYHCTTFSTFPRWLALFEVRSRSHIYFWVGKWHLYLSVAL